jgi:hypothetical protein
MMATPTTAQLAKQHDLMLRAFQEYRSSLHESMGDVEAALDRKEYALACRQLSAISQSHARTSVNLRNALIRNGFLSKESEDD